MIIVTGLADNQYVYFVARFSKPFQTVGFVQDRKMFSAEAKLTGTDLQAVLTFDDKDSEPVIAKVGLSIVSVDNARENLDAEVKISILTQCVLPPVVLGNRHFHPLLWREAI